MPIVLDQPETDSNSGSQGNLNILELVHKPPEYNTTEQNFSETIQLEGNEVEHDGGQKSGVIEGEQKKDWSLKYVSDIYHSDKLSNFSCSSFRGKENGGAKEELKKHKKKNKSNVTNPVNMQMNFQNGNLNSQDMFLMKQLKMKNDGNKGKKFSNKLKEKINGIKKGYKPIAPYPSGDDQKLTVVQNPVPKHVSSQMNPILIVKIDDQGVNESKQKMPEYFSYNEKKIENSEYVQPYNFENVSSDLDTDLKNKKNYVAKTKCYKCYNCPFVTLNKDYLNYHFQKKQKCFANNEVFHCPGCKNIFHSLTPLKIHLMHDHKVLSKEVKVILQSIQEVRCGMAQEKSSCVFQSDDLSTINGNMFNSNMNSIEMPLTDGENREEIEKDFENLSNGHLSGSREIEQCGNGKRQTMLESYLDDINNKGECNLPPTLNHNGSALLENTFK